MGASPFAARPAPPPPPRPPDPRPERPVDFPRAAD